MDAKTLNDLGQPSYRERRYYEAGREQGMREAAALAGSLTKGYYGHAKAPYITYRDAILAAIGEGK